MNTLSYVLMKLLPKCLVSRAFGAFTRLKIPVISSAAKNWFAAHYKLDMSESEYPLSHYENIAQLFIRRLKPNARVIASDFLVSPVDGVLCETGFLDGSEMIQAKGKTYTLESLLRDSDVARDFNGGAWATIYLAPFNYHRIHSPVAGKLLSASYCPGTLWPVNKGSVERVEGLFCINERLTTRIDCGDGCEVLVVKVGATNVGRIAVEYSKDLLTNAGKLPRIPRYDWHPKREYHFSKGGELGRFEMGSTVILVVNRALLDRAPELFVHKVGSAVRVGEAL